MSEQMDFGALAMALELADIIDSDFYHGDADLIDTTRCAEWLRAEVQRELLLAA